MADKKKLLLMISLQVTTFLSLLFQQYGLIILWKINELNRSYQLVSLLQRKRCYFLQKLKISQQRKLARRKRRCWVTSGKTDQWWQNMIGGIVPEDQWIKNFRMTHEKFYELVEELRPYISPEQSSPNYRALTADKKVAVTLYYLKDTGSLGMTANTFGIAICTVSSVIFQVCKAISTVLGPRYLKLPQHESEMRHKVSEFEAKFGMVQAFGCIDGTHIPIKRPVKDPQDYFCYKGFYSLNVQAVCDYRGVFMDVECRWPGSVHDAKVFANSSLNYKLREKKIPATFQTVMPGCDKTPNYLIGDPAYPLTPYCMKEYETCQKNEQVVFNGLLRAARNPIECSFGRLKARWSILTRKMDLKLESIPTVVYSCFVLHNYCEKNKIYVDECHVRKQVELSIQNEINHRNIPDPVYSCNAGEGEVVRRVLTENIRDNLPDALLD